MRTSPPAQLREHLHFIIIVPLLIIVMTWPTAAHVFEPDSNWLAGHDVDWQMLFWDAWYAERIIAGGADFFYTDLKFYPDGVSLAFHNFSLPHMFLFAGLQALMPAANAFNLSFLLLTLINVTAGYVYLNYLLRDRWAALFGAIVFGLCTFVLSRPSHPNNTFLASMPLCLYFFHRAVDESSLARALLAGVMLGGTAFIGMYTLVCLLATWAVLLACFMVKRWRDKTFWLVVIVVSLVGAAFVALRFYPMLADQEGLDGALAKFEDREWRSDLLANFVNPSNPVTRPLFDGLAPNPGSLDSLPRSVYIGYIPLLLLLISLARRDHLRAQLPWLIVAAVFLVLRLGAYLVVAGVEYRDVLLPKHYLAQWFPYLIKPFWWNSNFYAGAVLPIAVIAGYGLLALSQRLSPRRGLALTLVLCAAVAVEQYQTRKPIVYDDRRTDYIDWLKTEDDQASIRLINLAMGSQLSKTYDYHQSVHGYPHVEGRPTRIPPAAFGYIDANALLESWSHGKSVHCLPSNETAFGDALDQLLADGFSHVILHRWLYSDEPLAHSFVGVPAAYRDGYVSIYRLGALRMRCENAVIAADAALPQLRDLALSPSIMPNRATTVLSLGAGEPISPDRFDFYASVFGGWKRLAHVYWDAGDLAIQSSDGARDGLHSVIGDTQAVLLARDTRRSDTRALKEVREMLAVDYQNCARLHETDDVIIDKYVTFDFPCALVNSAQPLEVEYSNGLQLANLVTDLRGRELDIYLWWRARPPESHAFSIQLFDASGAKAHQQDFIIWLEPLMRATVDLPALPPGEYQAKLIVYNYATGQSLSGIRVDQGSRFDRELDFTTLTIE